jgi:hypothetical protein
MQHTYRGRQRDGTKAPKYERNRVVVGLPCDTRRWQCFADSHAVMILFTHSVSQWQTALVSLWFQAESAFLSLQLWTSTERYPYGIADYGNPGTFHEPYAALHYTVGSAVTVLPMCCLPCALRSTCCRAPQSVGATLVSDDIDGCVCGRYGTCDGPHQRRTATCNRQFPV